MIGPGRPRKDAGRNPEAVWAIEKAGGVSALARICGVTAVAVSQWERVPRRHVPLIEAALGPLLASPIPPPGAVPTPAMQNALDTYRETGSFAGAAAVLGCSRQAVHQHIRRYKEYSGKRIVPRRLGRRRAPPNTLSKAAVRLPFARQVVYTRAE